MDRDLIKRLARIGLWLAAAVAYAAAIMPNDPHVFQNDKANHGLAFVVLAILGRLGYSRAAAAPIGLALVAFGGFIELSQAVPLIHRDASWADLLADTIAVVVGLTAGTLLLMLIRRGRPA